MRLWVSGLESEDGEEVKLMLLHLNGSHLRC